MLKSMQKKQSKGFDGSKVGASTSSSAAMIPPHRPSDPNTEQAVTQLVNFVQQNGRKFERQVKEKAGTREDPRFRFLFEPAGNDYRYYLMRLQQTVPEVVLPIEVAKIMVRVETAPSSSLSIAPEAVAVPFRTVTKHGAAAAHASMIPSESMIRERLETKRGRELKEMLVSWDVPSKGCLDKNDLIDRILRKAPPKQLFVTLKYSPQAIAAVQHVPPGGLLSSAGKGAAASVQDNLELASLPFQAPAEQEAEHGAHSGDFGGQEAYDDGTVQYLQQPDISTGLNGNFIQPVVVPTSINMGMDTAKEGIAAAKAAAAAAAARNISTSTAALSSALSDTRVQCRNASNPYHSCTEFCSRVEDMRQYPEETSPPPLSPPRAKRRRRFSEAPASQQLSDPAFSDTPPPMPPGGDLVPPPLPPEELTGPAFKRREQSENPPPLPPPLLPGGGSDGGDSIAKMNAWMDVLRKRDEEGGLIGGNDAPPRPAGLNAYLPKEVAKEFDAKLKGKQRRQDETNKLDQSNKGHQLLQKLGWKEGETLGKEGRGILNPVKASGQKVRGAGIGGDKGAYAPGDVSAKDDAFTAYKKRMALAYQFRPNPLNNPRKKYWEDPNMNQGATFKQ
eukprot:gb/GEZN01003258.1/.p1 GENE.gb/GEZN01003258.1/~~gb/GEZN01003258.1/.p1  ORF type:complete len:646 (-),score=120.59 gb/GEZN01003258.1/:288-2138(-)